MNKTLIIILLVLGLVGSWWYFLSRPQPQPEIIIDERIDTVKVEKPVPTYVYLKDYYFFDVVRDSLIYVESPDSSHVQIPIPIEEKTYTDDSTYTAVISGFRPNLESIEVYQKTTTITQTIYKRPLVSFGIGIGVGFDPVHKTCSPTISLQATIPFYSIYR